MKALLQDLVISLGLALLVVALLLMSSFNSTFIYRGFRRMILDHLDHAETYVGVHHGVARALRYLRQTELSGLAPGRHDIDGDKLFARVVEYETQHPHETFWEAHRKYIDVQFLHEGVELMGYAPLAQMEVSPYHPEEDYVRCEGTGEFFRVAAGHFAVFWPHDAHMPGLVVSAPSRVRKIVVKVAVE